MLEKITNIFARLSLDLLGLQFVFSAHVSVASENNFGERLNDVPTSLVYSGVPRCATDAGAGAVLHIFVSEPKNLL